MSVGRIQIRKIISRYISESFKRGTKPAMSRVPELLGIFKQYLGHPFFPNNQQPYRGVSNIKLHNENIEEYIGDIKDITEEIIDQYRVIASASSASDIEHRKLHALMDDLSQDISSAVESTAKGQMVFSENFTNNVYIDTFRSSIMVDTIARQCILPIATEAFDGQLVFNDYGDGIVHPVRQDHGSVQVVYDASAPFENIITLNEYFRFSIKQRLRHTAAECHFDIDFNFVEKHNISKIRMDIGRSFTYGTDADGLNIRFRYYDDTIGQSTMVNRVEQRWYMGNTFIWEPDISTNIDRIRIYYKLNGDPNRIEGEFGFWDFGIKQIRAWSVSDSEYHTSGRLISKSINIDTNDFGRATVNRVRLETGKFLPEDTDILYYVAPDRYIPGTFMAGDDPVVFGHPDIDAFIPYGSDIIPAAESGVLQSEIRTFAQTISTGWLYEGFDYTNWEPGWIPITTIDTGRVVSETGSIAVGEAVFDTVSVVAGATLSQGWPEVSGQPDVYDNGIEFYRMYNFATMPIASNMVVRQGKDTWVHTSGWNNIVITTNGTGTVDVSPTFTASGNIVSGSIVNVGPIPRHPGTPRDAAGYYNGVGPNPQYFVSYDNANMSITRNQLVAGNEIPVAQDIEFVYSYKKQATRIRWETNYYLGFGEAISITVGSNGMRKTTVKHIDSFGVDIETIDVAGGIPILFNKQGWYNVIVDIPSGSLWNPYTKFSIDGSYSQFAWREPLNIVSSYHLKNYTHRDNHSNVGLIYPESTEDVFIGGTGIFDALSNTYLLVNDPTMPTKTTNPNGYIEIYNENITAGALPVSGIFESGVFISNFYDISFSAVNETIDHLLFKAEFYTNSDKTPILYGYKLKSSSE